jgi:hypothetical protein
MLSNDPDQPRAWCQAVRLQPWLFSAAAHAALLGALGSSVPSSPQQPLQPPVREGSIVLVARFSDSVECFADERQHVVVRASFESPASSAPELLAPNTLPGPQFPNPHASGTSGLPSAASAATSASVALPATGIRSPSTETHVFGVRGKGSRFVYVFDRSSSMEGAPLAAAKRELIASLQNLQSIHQFQIIFYNQEPQLMPSFRGQAPRMAFGDDPGKRQAATFIGGIMAFGATDHVKALATALRLRPDVIFFLTDADEPQLLPSDFDTIRRLNQGTVINTIEFGVGPPQPRYSFLQQLAAENGGEHGYIDVTRLVR